MDITVGESFDRGVELGRETRQIPGEFYNLIHSSLAKATKKCLFVPIRSMQYLAVIDKEEIIFVDSLSNRDIELSWQQFKPQTRENLIAAVPYELVYYQHKALETMKRLQREFQLALVQIYNKQKLNQSSSVLAFRR